MDKLNRPICYRAWDKKNKCMIFPEVLYLNNEMKDYIYLQWTGLLDRQGIKIYEGDIVKFIYTEFNMEKEEDVGEGRAEQIIFDEEEACFKIPSTYSYEWEDSSNIDIAKKLEVIGNIYSNSNLINN